MITKVNCQLMKQKKTGMIVLISKILCGLSIICFIASCQNNESKEYNVPINQIENIKDPKTSFYGDITLTMEEYSAEEKEIIASFIFKNKKGSVRLKFNPSEKELKFIRIGKESDYFLYAIAELFEEKLHHSEMEDSVTFSINKKGDDPQIDLLDKENVYDLYYNPNLNGKGSVNMRMMIDLELGKIKLWEKNGGIAKKNVVKALSK